MGAWMGSITFTGSVIAYGKLAGSIDSAALALPGRDFINMGLVSGWVDLCGFCVLSVLAHTNSKRMICTEYSTDISFVTDVYLLLMTDCREASARSVWPPSA
jgi:NAD/NADP transhydrogenase beta subunit